MKNSPISAFVLLGAATLIGAVTWFAMDDDRIDSESKVVTSDEAAPTGPRVVNLTPYEQRKKGRLEGARRKIEKFKQEGTVLPNGAIKYMDLDGTPSYVHPELIEGVGRYGEPFYAMVQYKKRAALPLRDEVPKIKNPKAQPQLKRMKPGQSVLTFGNKDEDQQRIPKSLRPPEDPGDGDDSGGGGGNQGGGKPGNPKDG